MFSFFYFLSGIYTSTNYGTISATESVASNMNDIYNANSKRQCNQISNNKNIKNQFLEQENFEPGEIIESALDLEEELRYKNAPSSASDNLIFDTMNSRCFKDINDETFGNPACKKTKLDDNSRCIIFENARHSEETFQNNPSIYNNYSSNGSGSHKQYDEVLSSGKDINDQDKNQNDNIRCEEIIPYTDKKDLLNKFYIIYLKKFNGYLISKKRLNYNLIFQNETVKSNNQQSTNLDLFINFSKEVLYRLKSAFDEAKNEQISISTKVFVSKKNNERFIARLKKSKHLFHKRKLILNRSIERQIKKIENNSFFKRPSYESIKKLIVECNMFIKEVIKYFLSVDFNVNPNSNNINYIYNKCKYISQRYSKISRIVKLECIVVIMKISFERLEGSQIFWEKKKKLFFLFFKSVTHLSTDISWLISPLKDIMDDIDKEYEQIECN